MTTEQNCRLMSFACRITKKQPVRYTLTALGERKNEIQKFLGEMKPKNHKNTESGHNK